MKVAEHAKAQSRRSKDALEAHAEMAATLIRMAKAVKSPQTPVMDGRMARLRPMHYVLNPDHTVSPVNTDTNEALIAWARRNEEQDRRVALDEFEDGSRVSTVFLGLDHAFGGGPPLVFESMSFTAATKTHNVFGSGEREYHGSIDQRRYSTWDEAMRGHEEMVKQHRMTLDRLRFTTEGKKND